MLFSMLKNVKTPTIVGIFSSPGRSPGRAIVLPPVSALASALVLGAAFALAKCEKKGNFLR